MYLTERQLFQIAQRALRQYAAVVQPGSIDRVDPIRLAYAAGLDVRVYRLSADGSVCGAFLPEGAPVPVWNDDISEPVIADGRTVYLEEALWLDPSLRCVMHYTAAHETAHALLYRFIPAGACEQDVNDSGTEAQADALAGMLLLPAPLVRACMQHFRLPPKLLTVAGEQAERAGVARSFRLMADHLQVSRQALAIRMNRLGLLRTVPKPAYDSRWPYIFPEKEAAL